MPGGAYFRGYDVAGDGNGGTTEAPATVSAFELDKFEVTVGRYRAFVAAGAGTQAHPPAAGAGAHAAIPNSGWDPTWNAQLPADRDAQLAALACNSTLEPLATWTDAPGANENRPVTCLSWYDAMAFCAWDGGFVPSEAEWNFAAAGGDEQRAYPWSSPPGDLTIDPAHASYADADGRCMADGQPTCTPADLRPVGSAPAGDGRWGHADLAGNAAEWTLDALRSKYITPCTDCADLSAIDLRVERGGAAVTFATSARTGARIPRAAARRESVIGVRCARDVSGGSHRNSDI